MKAVPAPRPGRPGWARQLSAQPYALALVLLVLGLVVTAVFQPAYFAPRALANNLRSYLPLICLAVAQTVVVIGGGIDLSLGALLTLASVVMVVTFGTGPDGTGGGLPETVLGVLLGLLVSTLAGAVNGLCVALLRLQPVIATFATGSLWAGAALWVLPSPGGVVPQRLLDLVRVYALVPFAVWVGLVLLLVWGWFTGTRGARALYAVGGNPQAAYASGVRVELVRVASYAVAGFLAGLGALFLVSDIATGDPLLGGPLTLSSVVAVVIGGTRLSGGSGGVVGSIIGVVVLALLRQVVFYLGLSTQWQTLADGLIVVLALAGPGVARLARRGRA